MVRAKAVKWRRGRLPNAHVILLISDVIKDKVTTYPHAFSHISRALRLQTNPVDPDPVNALKCALNCDPLAQQVYIDLIALQHPKLACVGQHPESTRALRQQTADAHAPTWLAVRIQTHFDPQNSMTRRT